MHARLLTLILPALAAGAPLVSIPAGKTKPLVPTIEPKEPISVAAFRMERHAVTNADFLEFVKARPPWRRGQVKSLFASGEYLSHWPAPLRVAPTQARAPVTHVSYFAARAYCRWRGRRLPTVAEWEYVAAASADRADARGTPKAGARTLAWSRVPVRQQLAPVERGAANFYGVHDLHGVVWEWTEDFNSELVATELGGDPSLLRNLFCGDHGSAVSETADYGAFMRVAFRGSLEAKYTLPNLGFRCATSEEAP